MRVESFRNRDGTGSSEPADQPTETAANEPFLAGARPVEAVDAETLAARRLRLVEAAAGEPVGGPPARNGLIGGPETLSPAVLVVPSRAARRTNGRWTRAVVGAVLATLLATATGVALATGGRDQVEPKPAATSARGSHHRPVHSGPMTAPTPAQAPSPVPTPTLAAVAALPAVHPVAHQVTQQVTHQVTQPVAVPSRGPRRRPTTHHAQPRPQPKPKVHASVPTSPLDRRGA